MQKSSSSISRCRRLLIITQWDYPFGGGEEFMNDSLEWCASDFTEMIWLSFYELCCQKQQHVPHKKMAVRTTVCGGVPTAYVHAVPGSCGGAVDDIKHWLELLDPDVVHHQGSARAEVVAACAEMNVPVLTGYHFWHGAVVLSPETNNMEILANAHKHTADPQLVSLIRGTQQQAVSVYWASEFMQRVACLYVPECKDSTRVLTPVSREEKVMMQMSAAAAAAAAGIIRKYVTQINVHPGKGGNILKHCIENTTAASSSSTVYFQCVVTEPAAVSVMSEFLDSVGGARVLVLPRTEDIASVYASTKVLLVPSIVDETFCRVAFEGLMNGLPMIASPAGYLRTMLAGCDGCVLMPSVRASPELWCQVLLDVLSTSADKLAEMGAASRRRYEELVAMPMYQTPQNLRRALRELTQQQSWRRNVMIFAPWADQGLGMQARNYVAVLEAGGAKTAIFSYKPYYAGRHQHAPSEWAHPRCYYSPNIREHVTDEEIIDFVREYSIGTAIIPETCWSRVFEIAELLRDTLHVRVYAVPNVEILRMDELDRHEEVFDGILCNNEVIRRVFLAHSDKHFADLLLPVGYAIAAAAPAEIENVSPPPAAAASAGAAAAAVAVVKFLCLGGMNGFSRKQIDRVCEAFALLPKETLAQCEITVTNQNECEVAAMRSLMQRFSSNSSSSSIGGGGGNTSSSIRIIWKPLSHSEVNALYDACDVVIQVSKHEGLGIGFYEALSHGKPVITLDVPPHNEIIRPGVNGWLVPATLHPSTENPQAPIGSAHFRLEDLAETVSLAIETMRAAAAAAALKRALYTDYNTRLSLNAFVRRLFAALRFD